MNEMPKRNEARIRDGTSSRKIYARFLSVQHAWPSAFQLPEDFEGMNHQYCPSLHDEAKTTFMDTPDERRRGFVLQRRSVPRETAPALFLTVKKASAEASAGHQTEGRALGYHTFATLLHSPPPDATLTREMAT